MYYVYCVKRYWSDDHMDYFSVNNASHDSLLHRSHGERDFGSKQFYFGCKA